VIFERSDGSFSSVASMDMRRFQLKIYVRRNEKLLDCTSRFIVETLEEGFESSGLQKNDASLVIGDDGWAGAISHWFSVDIITVYSYTKRMY
jgi:hypothetical protein